MKKVLLAGTALVGLAVASTPAAAQISLELGGHFRGYGVFADSDEDSTTAPGDELREFDLRRDAEVHFTGEATTNNGLTVGVHSEIILGDEIGLNQTDETYLYVSGNFGRVNLGSEDGAAYLLQVAAPSADSNIDGLRSSIQAINTTTFTTGAAGGSYAAGTAILLDYDHVADLSLVETAVQSTDRLTYLTPKWNGFQAGLSYAPELGQNSVVNNVAGQGFNDNVGDLEDIWEIAARWDGEFEGFGISAGAGYSNASTEVDAAAGAFGSDDLEVWNAGLNFTFQAFSLGGAYLTSNNATDGAAINADTDTWVVGAAWDNGPYHLGVSYFNQENEEDVYGTAGDLEIDRIAVGAGYTYGPGMSVRAAAAFGESEANDPAVADRDFSQFTIGTDVAF